MSTATQSERVRVLIPLDGSEFSRQVIPYVIAVLRPATHALTLLRVAPTPEGHNPIPSRPLIVEGWSASDGWRSDEPPVYYSQVYEGAIANLEEEVLVEARRLDAAGFDVVPVVRFGEAATEIVDVVEEDQFELVVMATHGRSGLGRMLLGSVAVEVLRRVHVPVMMVRPLVEGAGERLPLPAVPTRVGKPLGDAST